MEHQNVLQINAVYFSKLAFVGRKLFVPFGLHVKHSKIFPRLLLKSVKCFTSYTNFASAS